MPAGHTRQPQTLRTDAGIVPYSVGADSISARVPCPPTTYGQPANEKFAPTEPSFLIKNTADPGHGSAVLF